MNNGMAVRCFKYIGLSVACISIFAIVFALGIGMDVTPASTKRSMDALARAHNKISVDMKRDAALRVIKEEAIATSIDVVEKEHIHAVSPWSFWNKDGGGWTLIIEISSGKVSAVRMRRQDDAIRPVSAPTDKGFATTQ